MTRNPNTKPQIACLNVFAKFKSPIMNDFFKDIKLGKASYPLQADNSSLQGDSVKNTIMTALPITQVGYEKLISGTVQSKRSAEMNEITSGKPVSSKISPNSTKAVDFSYGRPPAVKSSTRPLVFSHTSMMSAPHRIEDTPENHKQARQTTDDSLLFPTKTNFFCEMEAFNTMVLRKSTSDTFEVRNHYKAIHTF